MDAYIHMRHSSSEPSRQEIEIYLLLLYNNIDNFLGRLTIAKQIITAVSVRKISIKGTTLLYTLTRKRIKNVYIRVKPDGIVYVSADIHTPLYRVDEIVRENSDFILSALEKVKLKNTDPIEYNTGEIFYLLGKRLTLFVKKTTSPHAFVLEDVLFLNVKDPDDYKEKSRIISKFYDENCQNTFERIVRKIHPLFAKHGVEYPILKLRTMKSRWGSCMPAKHQITLNKRLIEAPLVCIEYVILHEYCHFIFADHSKNFYALLATYLPEYKSIKKLLNSFKS